MRQVATGRDKAKCLFGAFAWGTVVVATYSVVAAAARVVVVVIVAVIRRIHKLVLIIAQMRMSEWKKLISQLHFATHFIVDGVVGGWQRAEDGGSKRRGRDSGSDRQQGKVQGNHIIFGSLAATAEREAAAYLVSVI